MHEYQLRVAIIDYHSLALIEKSSCLFHSKDQLGLFTMFIIAAKPDCYNMKSWETLKNVADIVLRSIIRSSHTQFISWPPSPHPPKQ